LITFLTLQTATHSTVTPSKTLPKTSVLSSLPADLRRSAWESLNVFYLVTVRMMSLESLLRHRIKWRPNS
jgi:hypothetical protein